MSNKLAALLCRRTSTLYDKTACLVGRFAGRDFGLIRSVESQRILSNVPCVESAHLRQYATAPATISPSDLTSPSLVNKGIKKGPGGRSSVSALYYLCRS